MKLDDKNLQKYFDLAYPNVHGFTQTTFIKALDYLNKVKINKKGGVAEIGVYQGKSFLALNALVKDELSYAVDVFDSHVSEGSMYPNPPLYDTFISNIKKYDKNKGKNVVTMKGDSMVLDFESTIPPKSLRYFSVDGGHSATITHNDLCVAEKFIADDGVVFVDDICHPCWLGVMEGVLKYLLFSPNSRLVPFALGGNKLFMCTRERRDYYVEHMSKYEYAENFKTRGAEHPFFGFKITLFNITQQYIP